MALNLEQHYITQFTQNVTSALQIRGGAYQPYVSVGQHRGKQSVVVDYFGPMEMSEIVTPGAPVNVVNANLTRVSVSPISFELPVLITEEEIDKTLADPQSILTQNVLASTRRKRDEVIRDAFFADIRTGETGAGTEAFDLVNHRVDAAIGSSGDTGMNVEKIKHAVEKLAEANVDLEMETPTIAIGPKQLRELRSDDEYINRNYGDVILDSGAMKGFLGCNIIVTKILPTYGSYTAVPAWVPSGMHLGIWEDTKVRVDDRSGSLQGANTIQIKANQSLGATRTEAGRVIMIECT